MKADIDVLIIGGGISGIGAAYHLKKQCPQKSFQILEGLESFGGTWITHKYPGIRSDSDLYTFGYRFKPWVGAPIATAEEILEYLGEVIHDENLEDHILYNHHVVSAKWSSEETLWTIEAYEKRSGEKKVFRSNFLWMCQGYYNHEKGHTPKWDNMDAFNGAIVHPQTWPEDLDYQNKEVIVIGSGATTATIVPAMAAECNHITVIQRSPTYFIPAQNQQILANILRKFKVKEKWVHSLTRYFILFLQEQFIKMTFKSPEKAKKRLIDGIRPYLHPDYDIDTHFTPSYRPWKQRIAFVPDGDLFQGIKAGKATMVTDEISCFTKEGVKLKSGKEIPADIIVTATGFELSVLGGINFYVDDKEVDFSKTVTYRGTMFTGVPNMAWIMGYFRASWTLRVDLLGDFICRLLNFMDKKGHKSVVPYINDDDPMELFPWIDPDNFNPNYLMRSQQDMPKRGAKMRWQHTQNYWLEKKELPKVDLEKDSLHYK